MQKVGTMMSRLTPCLLLGALSLAAGPAGAVEYYLAAKPFAKALPDGSTVPMWGYVEDPAGTCFNAADAAARAACLDTLPLPTIPGPRLTVPVGDTDLTVHLSNGLPEPTSLLIQGLELPVSTGPRPTWSDGTTGPRTSPAQRVRSLGSEAAAGGGRESYAWTAAGGNPFDRSGSFIYHSGTHPQKQVYMGAYGAVTRDAAAGQVHPGVAYDNEKLLFYSEIDPDMNRSIAKLYDPSNPDYAAVDPYSTSIHYQAMWFLVNGEPFVTGTTPDYFVGEPGETTLLRLFSTAGETHVPTLQGLYMTIHAEDGIPYNWQDSAAATSTPAPRSQYSAMLPPLKTKDAIVQLPAAEGRYAVYDGNGYMTNPSDPTNFAAGDTVGGMLRFLAVLNDTDDDGVPDAADNCIARPNGPSLPDLGGNIQRDSNGDGYGNVCDTDLNNDNITNGLDVGIFRTQFLTPGPDADFNGDGVVNGLDLGILKIYFLQPPGPSCVTLAGGCQLVE